MRFVLCIAVACALLGSAGCRADRLPIGPSSTPSTSDSAVVASYSAALSASASCAGLLPADARVRQYVAKLHSDGRIEWVASTLHPPGGHNIVSSGRLSGNSFSLVIGTKVDPQSDDFHGLWDVLGQAVLNISGEGSGTVEAGRIAGRLAGVFSYYQDTVGTFCNADDHSFVMTPLP